MPTNYEERLKIPLEGNDETRFETSTGLRVATGYTRIVIGERGPYIEFNPKQIILANLHIPENEKYRLKEPMRSRIYYFEWRTNDDANVMFYEQLKTVDYADYKVDMLYASPFDLFIDREPIITKLNQKKNEDVQYLF